MVKNDLSFGKEMNPAPLIIAHRGASAYAPENTLAAFQAAIDAGSDGVEFDVQLSRDGVPVVIHDETLKRTCGLDKNVADLTASELSRVDAGSWFNKKFPKNAKPAFADETIPTLSQVLKLYEPTEGPIYVELKANDAIFAELATRVCDIVEALPVLPRVIVKSFKLAAIPVIRHRLPQVQTAALFAPQIMDYLRHKKYMIALAREFGAHQLSLHRVLATKTLTSLAHDSGMPVTIWTADKPKWIERCRKRGIGAIITNDPTAMLAACDKI